MPTELRERLATEEHVDAWFEAVGDELPRAWLQLAGGELEQVVELLVEAGLESAHVLRRLDELAPTKAARKLVRVAIHRLKSRGIDVEPTPRGVTRSVLRPVSGSRGWGLATPPDALGRRSLFLILPVPGGVRMYEIGVSDVDGIAHLEVFQAKRRDARAFGRRLRERDGVSTIEVEAGELRALVARSKDSAETHVDPKLLEEVVRDPGGETPGERLRRELAPAVQELDDQTADELVGAAVRAAELQAWPPVGEAVDRLAAQIEAIEHSPLVLTGLQQTERRTELIRESRGRVLDSSYRERVAVRLEESAVFLREAGKLETGTAALQVAGRVRHAEDPLHVSFLELMLTIALDAAAKRVDKRDPTRLIVPR